MPSPSPTACASSSRAAVSPSSRFRRRGCPVFRQIYAWYFTRLLPRIGRLVSHHTDAYTYLPASVVGWVTPEAFCATLRTAGFAEVRAVPLTFGAVYLYTATRPDRGTRG